MQIDRLRDYIDLVRMQRETEERIEELRTRLGLHAVATDGGGGGSTNTDRLAEPVAKIIELEEKLQAVEYELANRRIALVDWVNGIDDVRSRRLIMLRYYDGHSWRRVAQAMGIERNTAQKMHTKILLKYCD